ncbi:TnsD family Tn7-like transposition protein [Bacillus anthracis]|nr:TnsD family Tn7-like transposition protein [Bacillus anthracis]
MEGIQKFPNLSRTALRERFKKQYMFLYDKGWVMKNLPIKQKKPEPTKRVDWDKRDREYVVKIKNSIKIY